MIGSRYSVVCSRYSVNGIQFNISQVLCLKSHISKKMKRLMIFAALLLLAVPASAQQASQKKLKALIINGQSFYHDNWPEVTETLKEQLLNSGRFSVEVLTSKPLGEDISDFRPAFQNYDVVVSVYDGTEWAAPTKKDFERYMKKGGGFVSIHAADNAFPKWGAYNKMIGLGGWGERDEASGPYVYYNEAGERVTDNSQGRGGHHGKRHSYRVVLREEHPVTRGLPTEWMHVNDELYEQLRGPAENMVIMATAWADPETGGSGRHEPMLMGVRWGKGRIFHSVMGHDPASMQCLGFIITFLRGAEWAATGKVTIPVPDNFPTRDQVSVSQ